LTEGAVVQTFSLPIPGGRPDEAFTFGVRKYDPDTDAELVLKTWRREIRATRPIRNWIAGEQRRHMSAVVEPMLERCPPMMACHPDHPMQVFAFCCAEYQGADAVLHFIYERRYWRSISVGERLLRLCLPSAGKQRLYYTHKTLWMRHISSKYAGQWDPYRATQSSSV
jgi:hypothetical protein